MCQPQEQKTFISTANEALVGTLMTIGNVNDTFPIMLWLHSSICFFPFFVFSGDNSGRDTPLIISLLVVGTIIDGPCYCSNKDPMLVNLSFYFFLSSFRSRNGSFGTGVLFPLGLPGLHAAIPWVLSGLPFSGLISPLSFIFLL